MSNKTARPIRSMAPITETPNEFRCFLDNTDAKLLLVQFGLLDKLLEGAKRPDGPWSFYTYSWDHPTHWIIGAYFYGFSNPADNGFAVQCIPKSQFSLEQFRGIQRREAAFMFPNGYSIENVRIEPRLN